MYISMYTSQFVSDSSFITGVYSIQQVYFIVLLPIDAMSRIATLTLTYLDH